MKRLKLHKLFIIISIILLIGLLIPQNSIIPVEVAKKGDWNEKSFWYYPWGKSVTHKGVDIFASEGTNVISSTYGITLFKGTLGRGGKAVIALGPKWRLHYYAHLNEINIDFFSLLKKGQIIGKVGKTGNAQNTPAHLHYSIVTIIPYPWRIDTDKQGWKKMFYLNPIKFLNNE